MFWAFHSKRWICDVPSSSTRPTFDGMRDPPTHPGNGADPLSYAYQTRFSSGAFSLETCGPKTYCSVVAQCVTCALVRSFGSSAIARLSQ
jgi:hypothetical protein